MQPSEVRQAIVAQHEELRGLLRSLDELARRAAEADDACVPARGSTPHSFADSISG